MLYRVEFVGCALFSCEKTEEEEEEKDEERNGKKKRKRKSALNCMCNAGTRCNDSDNSGDKYN